MPFFTYFVVLLCLIFSKLPYLKLMQEIFMFKWKHKNLTNFNCYLIVLNFLAETVNLYNPCTQSSGFNVSWDFFGRLMIRLMFRHIIVWVQCLAGKIMLSNFFSSSRNCLFKNYPSKRAKNKVMKFFFPH